LRDGDGFAVVFDIVLDLFNHFETLCVNVDDVTLANRRSLEIGV
jgi:hypothetical protein